MLNSFQHPSRLTDRTRQVEKWTLNQVQGDGFGREVMIVATIAAALLAATAATPALAQNGPPPSPYTPRVDKPACTMDELKAATSAYAAGQKAGSLSALPMHEKAQ
jgi:hypothetical protein